MHRPIIMLARLTRDQNLMEEEGQGQEQKQEQEQEQVAQDPSPLELLRLRVLASRKRPKLQATTSSKEREDGEISESEPENTLINNNHKMPLLSSWTPPLLPPPPNHFHYAQKDRKYLGKIQRERKLKTNRKRRFRPLEQERNFETIDTLSSLSSKFLDDFAKEISKTPKLSESFEPQTCTFTVDSEAHSEDEQATVFIPKPDKTFHSIMDSKFSETTLITSANSFVADLMQKELEKQTELLAITNGQLEELAAERQALESKFEENEIFIREAVQNQQRLKAQVREAKQLIVKGKDIRADFLIRQRTLGKETSRKVKLAEMLKSSIQTKLNKSKLLMMASKLDESKSFPSEYEATQRVLRKNPSSKRSMQLVELEKQALKVRQELMGAQITLMQKRVNNAKRNALVKQAGLEKTNNKKPLPAALGKIMAMKPLLKDSHPVTTDALTTEDGFLSASELVLNNLFPPRLLSVGGHLISMELLSEIFESFSSLLLERATNEMSEAALELSENVKVSSGKSIIGFRNYSQSRSNHIPLQFEPYESPLRVFKSYRFSPYFTSSAPNQGLLSRTFTNRIRQNMPICLYDITGRCTHRNCHAQHFRTIFMPDSLVLEDFMTTLLCMPVKEPFKDQTHLLLHLKEKFLKFKGEQPLIALVGVIIDVFKEMKLDSQVISFEERLFPSAQVKVEIKSVISAGRHSEDFEMPFIDSRRAFLSGIADLKEGIIPRLWRYFDAEDKGGGGGGEGGILPYPDPTSKTLNSPDRALENFIICLSKGNIRDDETRSKAKAILEQASIENSDSELLLTLSADYSSSLGQLNSKEFSSILDKAKYGTDREDGVMFPWYLLTHTDEHQGNGYPEIMSCIESCLKSSIIGPSSVVVDMILASVRVSCDNGHHEDALIMLQLCLARHVDPKYDEGVVNSELILDLIQKVNFTATDIAYLAMMYFHVRDSKIYPQQAYLSFPFEMVRRTDAYYLQPWTKPEYWADDFVYLQQLLVTLSVCNGDSSSSPSDSAIFDWCSNNLLHLATKLKIPPKETFPTIMEEIEPSPAIKASMILHNMRTTQTFSEAEIGLIQSHPLVLITFLSVVLSAPDVQTVRQALVQSFLRAFWGEKFGIFLEDKTLVVVIGRSLGLQEFFNTTPTMSACEVTFSGEMRKDPFLWIMALISLVIFSVNPLSLSIVKAILECAISNVGDTNSMLFFLSCLYRLSDSEERNSLFSRIVSTAEVSGELPLSNVNHLWQQRSWRQSLTAPLDEFIQLNLSPVDDSMCLANGILCRYIPEQTTSELTAMSPYLAFRFNVDQSQALSILSSNPTDLASWIIALRTFKNDREATEKILSLSRKFLCCDLTIIFPGCVCKATLIPPIYPLDYYGTNVSYKSGGG